MPNFNMYTKTTEQVFELNKKLTLKINVYFNEIIKLNIGDEIQTQFHNEFIVSGSNITTNLKYRYNLQLSPRGDYDNSIYIDWDNYDDFFTAIESVINISSQDNPRCPFIRKYSDTGDLLDIQFNTMNTKYFIFKDKYRNVLEIIPSVLYNLLINSPLEGTERIRARYIGFVSQVLRMT